MGWSLVLVHYIGIYLKLVLFIVHTIRRREPFETDIVLVHYMERRGI